MLTRRMHADSGTHADSAHLSRMGTMLAHVGPVIGDAGNLIATLGAPVLTVCGLLQACHTLLAVASEMNRMLSLDDDAAASSQQVAASDVCSDSQVACFVTLVRQRCELTGRQDTSKHHPIYARSYLPALYTSLYMFGPGATAL